MQPVLHFSKIEHSANSNYYQLIHFLKIDSGITEDI